MDTVRWGGDTRTNLNVMIIKDKVYVDWNEDFKWEMVLTFNKKNKFNYSFKNYTGKGYIIRKD